MLLSMGGQPDVLL